ncbi:MAG: flagellar basal body-associated FliL family protein [Blastocatellia bacterium]
MAENTETAKTNEQVSNNNTPSSEPAKKPANKIVLILITIIVLLVAGGGGAFFYITRVKANDNTAKGEGSNKEKNSKSEDEDEDEWEDEDLTAIPDEKSKKSKAVALLLPKDKAVKHVIELQPFILNLADTDESRYLRLAVSVGLGGDVNPEEKPNSLFIARLRNALLAVLMTKSSTDVLSIEGKVALRKELLKAAKKVVDQPEIETVYITELIVQK